MSGQCRSVLRAAGFAACLVPAQLGVGTADDKPPVAALQPAKVKTTEYGRPVLAALTWQHVDRTKSQDVQPAWRPDGEQIGADEAKWLHKELGTFDGRTHGPGILLRALIVVFRVDEQSKSPQLLKATVIANGRRIDQSGFGDTDRSFLSRSEFTIPLSLLPEWPAEVDVEVRVPVAEPELVKRIEKLPEEPIQLDRGVKWYVDPAGGAELRSRGLADQLPGPAFILHNNCAESDPLVVYTYEYRLKDKNSRMRTSSIRRSGEIEADIRQIVSGDPSIMWVEFYRQRYRIEKYEKVRLRKDLMPD